MKILSASRMLWVVALTVVAVGMLMTLRSIDCLRSAETTLNEKIGDLRALRDMADELDEYMSAREAYERVPGGRPVKLEIVLAGALNGVVPLDIRASVDELDDGWLLRRKEVTYGELPLAGVVAAVRKAEAQRPPWSLVECAVRASALNPGHGRAVLTFEALERSSRSSPGHAP